MIWAIKEGERIKATKNINANCPVCNKELIAKCGEIITHHWAHKINSKCDSWCGESDWHLEWKSNFEESIQEILMIIGDHKHIADIHTHYGLTIEFQNSPISSLEINNRETFYDKMIWVLNGDTIAKGLCLRNKGTHISFRWKHPPKSWWNANKKIYIDLGNYIDEEKLSFIQKFELEHFLELKKEYNNKILHVKKIYNEIPCGGWGVLLTKEQFITNHGGIIKNE